MSLKNESCRLSESSSDSDTPVKKHSSKKTVERDVERPFSHARKPSKKSKQYIAPVSFAKKPSAYELFGTDSEDEGRPNRRDVPEKTNKSRDKKRSTSPPAASSSEPASKKMKSKPYHSSSKKLCAREVPEAGSDYEDRSSSQRRDRPQKIYKSRDEKRPTPPPASSAEIVPRPNKHPSSSKKLSAREVFGSDSDDPEIDDRAQGKKTPILSSQFTKRIASGVSRQSQIDKIGTHYVDLKVYKCDEIKNVQPMNRWRNAIISIKTQTNDDTEAWEHLAKYIAATRREFKNCRPDIIGSYF